MEEAYRLLLIEHQKKRIAARIANDPWRTYRNDPVGFILEGLHQCREDSWRGWRTILKAAYGTPLDNDELEFFRNVAQRDPPPGRVRELWLIVGRRGGKDSIASLMAVEASRFADCIAMRPGERAIVACLASDRDQASIVFGYIRGYFETIPSLMPWVQGDLPLTYRSGPIKLANSIDVRVTTNNFRAPRGRPVACAIFDECAFWRDENSATPDVETYRAIEPGMATIANSMLIGITTPYRKAGLVYQKYREHFGKNDPNVLVIQAETRLLNPMIDLLRPGLIEKAYEDDPESAKAEYGALFRDDLADYVPREVVERLVIAGRTVLPPEPGLDYFGFTDPSGGSRDSMTLAIAHPDSDGRGILDLVVEWRAPFVPSVVTKETCQFLKTYGLYKVTGDRYGGEWPVDEFAKNDVNYEHSELFKSDIYRDSLPLLMSSQVELLDNKRMVNQIVALERRTARGGRDSIDHPPNMNDDVANAVLGALVHVTNKTGTLDEWRSLAR
jgi:hypothetical protein